MTTPPPPAPHERRKRTVRSRVFSVRRLVRLGVAAGEPTACVHDRPQTRAECVDGHRPCPFVSCTHLYLDVTPETGSLKLNFPDLEVDELAETCALDVADRGPHTLEDVGDLLNITRERARQIEAIALDHLRALQVSRGLAADSDPVERASVDDEDESEAAE